MKIKEPKSKGKVKVVQKISIPIAGPQGGMLKCMRISQKNYAFLIDQKTALNALYGGRKHTLNDALSELIQVYKEVL